MHWPSYEDVLAARSVVHHYMKPTPTYEYPALSEMFGCRFFIKHENHTPTTAFKVRGGIYLVSRLSEVQKRTGIIACTTGNHGQSLAFASRIFGVRCVLVVPAKNNPDKVAAMRSWGAEIIEHGKDFDEARERCEVLSEEKGLRYVHSANEPDLIAGVGTYALELFDDVPDADEILVPVGLGSGICGTCIVAAHRRPETAVIGLQSEGAPAVTLSWKNNTPTETTDIDTFAEGVATRKPAELTLAIMQKYVRDMLLLNDDDLRQGIRLLLEKTHNLAEGAGAAAVAAVRKWPERFAGKTVVGVLSGGNLELRELPRIF